VFVSYISLLLALACEDMPTFQNKRKAHAPPKVQKDLSPEGKKRHASAKIKTVFDPTPRKEFTVDVEEINPKASDQETLDKYKAFMKTHFHNDHLEENENGHKVVKGNWIMMARVFPSSWSKALMKEAYDREWDANTERILKKSVADMEDYAERNELDDETCAKFKKNNTLSFVPVNKACLKVLTKAVGDQMLKGDVDWDSSNSTEEDVEAEQEEQPEALAVSSEEAEWKAVI
jgi:hypothetical protein